MCAVHTSMQHPDSDRPCETCGSQNHGTGAHAKLEKVYARWGLGLTPLPQQTEIDLAGTPGQPSPSGRDSVPPDQVRIVPFTISGPGTTAPYRGAGILRLWKLDPEGGCTFMLSWGQYDLPSLTRSLARLFGAPGIVVSVDAGSNPSIQVGELLGTSPSI